MNKYRAQLCPDQGGLALVVLLASLAFGIDCARPQAVQARIVVQSSPLAGFRHHEAPNLWREVQAGDELALVREPDNPHDRNAVRVEWRSYKLGYVPRSENEAVSRLLDGGTRLLARVSQVRQTRAPNRRIEFEIYMPIQPGYFTRSATNRTQRIE